MNSLELLKESPDKTAKKEVDISDILKNKNSFGKPKLPDLLINHFRVHFLVKIKRNQKEIPLQEYLLSLLVNTGNMHTYTHTKQQTYFKLKTLSLFDNRFPTDSY